MSRRRVVAILNFQELTVGDEWESQGRTITESDVSHFAGLSGDFNPLHIDYEYSKNSTFAQPVAHGLLGLTIASGLASHAPRVDTMAFLAILEWHFHHPILFGDTIRLVSRVESLEPKSRGRRGLVVWDRRLINQHGRIVQSGRLQTMVRGAGSMLDPEELNSSS